MAQRFLLTAQLRLAPPANIRAIVSHINAGLAGITANVTINTTGLNSQLGNITRNLRNTSKAASSAANDMEKFGEQAAIAIRRYGAFTLATTAFLKLTGAISSGIDEAIAFDRELVRIAQVTGHSVGGLKDLNDEVTRLSKEFGVSSTKILESAQTLAQAGLSARDVKIALEALAKTGVSATFGDIKDTTEASIAIMQQFGKEAKDLEGILGSINSVSAKFAVESEDIAVAVRRTGGAFAAAGGSLEEFQALFTSVRQTTRESAETIATGFRTIFTRIQRSRTQNFLQSLGIDLKDVEGQFVGPYEAIRRLSGALKDLKSTDPRFAQIIEELGGFRQISKVIPLITKFDVSQQALNVAMRGGNSLSKDAETAQEALAIQLTKVKEEFLALIRVVTNNSAFRGMIDLTLKLSSTLIKLATTLEPVLPLLATFAAAQVGTSAGAFFTGFGRKIKGHNQGGPVHAFARGGLVPGQGNGDTVAANLTPGEFVIRKKAVEAIGADKLHQMNKFAKGGKVYTFPYPERQGSMYGTGATLTSDLSDAEKKSLKDYTEEGYIPINSFLKGRGLNRPDNDKNISNIDSAMKKSRFDSKVSYLLYRGIGKNRKDEISKQIGVDLGTKEAVGRSYLDAGYVSTSRSKAKAATFGNHEIVIKTKPGANGLDVMGHSGNALEKEILLPRNSRFKILEAEPYDSIVQQLNRGGFVYNEQSQRYEIDGNSLTKGDFAKVIIGAKTNDANLKTNPYTLSMLESGTGPNLTEVQEKRLQKILGSKPAAKAAVKAAAKKESTVNLTDIPNLITGDPEVKGSKVIPIGRGKGVPLSTLLTNASKSDKEKLSKYSPNTLFTGRMSIHGLRKEVASSFNENVETALSQVAKQLVSKSPIKDFAEGASNDRNITSLISYSAIQSMKGNLLEAFTRIVTGSKITYDEGGKDSRIDFDKSQSTNLEKVFDGSISGRSEAKINAGRRSQNSVILKGLVSEFANGGSATGTDTVPAMLTPGEFVLNKRAAASLGSATLHQLNNADKVKKYAAGGHVQKFAAGGSPVSLGSIASNPLALVGIISSLGALSSNFVKADSATGKLINGLESVAFQFVVFKGILDNVKPDFAHKAPFGDTRSKDRLVEDLTESNRARLEKRHRDALSAKGASQDEIDRRVARKESSRNTRASKLGTAEGEAKFNSTANKFARGFSAVGIAGGVAAQVGGGFLSDLGQKEIAQGKASGVNKAFAGDVISGAGTGLAIGAMFGPFGAAAGLAAGGLIALYNATGKYEKQLEAVKFAKKMEEFSRTVDRFASGKLSLKEARGDIISGVSDTRRKAVGEEAKDIKAKFANNSGNIEKFIDEIAKESKSFDELEKSTGDLINHFSILTDLPYATLKDQLEKQIAAYQKSATALTKLDKLIEEETRTTIVLAAMNTAINDVNSSFDSFDAALANSAAFLSGRGASFQAKDFGAILEKVGVGKFSNQNKLKELGGQVVSPFGKAGEDQVDKLAESARALAELPSILLAVKNKAPLGEGTGDFVKKLEEELAGRFSRNTINSITGGVDKFIGAEDKDEKILNGINDNLSAVVAEVGKSLQTTVDVFKEFAPAFKNQTERIRSAFDLYTESQIKVAEYQQSIAKNSEASTNFKFDATGKTRSSTDVRSGELNRIGLLTGGVTDSRVLGARLKAAQDRASNIAQGASETLDPEQTAIFSRELAKANIEARNTAKALEELANSSEGLGAIQQELAIEEQKRKFKENITLTAIFGSREAKQDLNKKAGFSAIAATSGIDAVPEQEIPGVLEFLQSAGKQKFGGIEADELIKILAERSVVGQSIGSDIVRKNLTQADSPNAAKLIDKAQELIAEQSKALEALSGNAKAIGDEASKAIAKENDRFLAELRRLFIDKLIGEKDQAIVGKKGDLATAEAKNKAVKFLSGETGIGINDGNIKDVQPAVDKLKSIKAAQIEKQRLDTINKHGVGFKLDVEDTKLNTVLEKIKDDANKAGLDFDDKDLKRISDIVVQDTTLEGKGFGFGTPDVRLSEKFRDNVPLSQIEIDKFNKGLQDFIVEKNKEKTNKNRDDISNLIRDLNISGTEVGKSIAKELTDVGLNDTQQLQDVITALEINLKALGTDSIDKLTPSIQDLTKQIAILNGKKGELVEAQKDPLLPIPLRRAIGGGVPGIGNGDTVPAMLTPGEFVIRKSAVESIGLDTLHAMNNGYAVGGVVQKFAKGGKVRYFSGGAGGKEETETQKKKREAEEEARVNRSAYNSLQKGGNLGFTSISEASEAESKLRDRGTFFTNSRPRLEGADHDDLTRANELRETIDRARRHELSVDFENARRKSFGLKPKSISDTTIVSHASVAVRPPEVKAPFNDVQRGFKPQPAYSGTQARLSLLRKRYGEKDDGTTFEERKLSAGIVAANGRLNGQEPGDAVAKRNAAETQIRADRLAADTNQQRTETDKYNAKKQTDADTGKTYFGSKSKHDAITVYQKEYRKNLEASEALAAAKSAERAKSAEAFAKVQGTRGVQTQFQKDLGSKADSLAVAKPSLPGFKVQPIATSNTADTIKNSGDAAREKFLRDELRQGTNSSGRTTYGEGRKDQLFEYRQELGKILRDRAAKGQTPKQVPSVNERLAALPLQNKAISEAKRQRDLKNKPRTVPDSGNKSLFDFKPDTPRIQRLEAIRANNEAFKNSTQSFGIKGTRNQNRAAFRARGGFGQQRFNTGGEVGGGGGSINIQGITELRSVVETFSTVVDNMTSKLAEFKDFHMEITATHRVEVIHNGAEVLAQMDKKFQELAMGQAITAINKMIDNKFPDVGRVIG